MIKVVSVLIRVTVLLQPLFRRRVCKGRTRAHSLVHGAVLRRGIAGVTGSRSLITSEVIVKCLEEIENSRIFIGNGVAATLHIRHTAQPNFRYDVWDGLGATAYVGSFYCRLHGPSSWTR